MSLSSVVLYNGVTIGSTATPSTPYSAGQLSPNVNSTLVGNALVFNYVVVNGSSTPGQNPTIVFNYGFSMSASYTPSVAAAGILSANKFNIRVPNTLNTTLDITTQISIPIIGNSLYYWLDVNNLIAPITLTINAVVVPVCNQVYNFK